MLFNSIGKLINQLIKPFGIWKPVAPSDVNMRPLSRHVDPDHMALMRMNANNTMRSSMKPCWKREIWVSP